ncbi:MAG: 50S ribosomal protein L19 [candidate division WOR-3 bacterium]|nr:MAG: 50S ribosomal protein L19 [candidate division WOR-3 bacterium]
MDKMPDIKPGDLVKVYTKIIEGDKERLAPFQGVVIKVRGSDIAKTFTVRKVSAGVGIERIFPIHSPMIARVEIKKKGKVRRAKLTYLRQRRGKRMKIKEAVLPTKAKPEEVAEETPPPSEAEETTGESATGPETVEKV